MDTLVRQTRQRVPLFALDLTAWLEDGFPSAEAQQTVLDHLTQLALHNAYYAENVLKGLLNGLEKIQTEDDEVLDGFYELLCEHMAAQALDPTATDVVGYTMKTDPADYVIRIRESPRLISGSGTTGLRTWEASLFLSQWLLECMDVDTARDFEGKTVMELGCGTGLVGISLYRLYQKCQRVIFTDGDTQLVDRMSSNLTLNSIAVDAPDVQVCKLWWGEDDLPQGPIHTIVAADVTYDESVIPDLACVLDEAMSQQGVQTAYIAATVRNERTIERWEEYLEMGRQDEVWDWQVVASSRQRFAGNHCGALWYPVGVAEIRIYRLRRYN